MKKLALEGLNIVVFQTRSTPDGEETIENDNGRPRDQQVN